MLKDFRICLRNFLQHHQLLKQVQIPAIERNAAKHSRQNILHSWGQGASGDACDIALSRP